MKNHIKTAFAVATAASLLGAAPAFAQDTQSAAQAPEAQTTVSGSVYRERAGVFTLQSGQTIYVNNDTIIKPSGAVGAGTHVTITGTVNADDGSINATEIDVAGPRN